LAGVVSRDGERAAIAAAEFGGNPYSSIDSLIADPSADVVFICTPYSLHYEMSLKVLRAGKRIICEKPLSSTVVEAEELARQAETRRLPNVVNFTYHSLPGQRFVAQLLHEGRIGRLRHIDLTYWQARQRLPNASPSDALMEVGSHEVDLVTWWLAAGAGGELVDVAALETESDTGGAAIFTALGRTTTGAIVSIQANRVAAGWRNGMSCQLIGDDGSLAFTFETDQNQISVARFGDGSAEGTIRNIPIPPELTVSYAEFPAFHIDRLVAALEGEIEFPDFAYGARCQRLLAAIRTATTEHRWVSVDEQLP
jgi:predicted dehydrogenase